MVEDIRPLSQAVQA